MSTSVQEKEQKIEELLDDLCDEHLTRSHNSVKISYEQMRAYINTTFFNPDLRAQLPIPKDIRLLLHTFIEMAPEYFTQFELSLLQEISNQRRLSNQAQEVTKQINLRLQDIQDDEISKAMQTAKGILQTTDDTAQREETNLKKRFPTLLQTALDNLKVEWQRLNSVAAASRTITGNEKLIQALDVVVGAARFSVGIKVSRIAVVPGDSFSLQFYSYLKNFAVLTVPIYSVQAPWEWSIFWHELAGDKVRRLEQNTASEIEAIRDGLRAIHTKWQEGTEEYKKKLLDFLTRNNQYPEPMYQETIGKWKNKFAQTKLREFFSNKRLNWRDLGDLEHQFERILENLPQKDSFKYYEEIKAQGWCVGWIKELFEDAWSVIAIREPFINFLEDVLNRHVIEDGRHPRMEIRVAVAKKILELMNSDEELKDPADIIESAAQQILMFVSLLTAPTLARVFEISQAPNDPDSWKTLQPPITDLVGGEIGKYIQRWYEGLSENNSHQETSKDAEEFIRELSRVNVFSKSLNTPIEEQLKEVQATYNELLLGDDQLPKDYKELLKLSFYDVDFNVGQNLTYTFMYPGVIPLFTITSENLSNALDPLLGYIRHFALGVLGNRVTINNDDYSITEENLHTLVGLKWVV